MRHVWMAVLLMWSGCTSMPDGGEAPRDGSAAPDGGSFDLCRGRGETRHPDPPDVPFCADGPFDARAWAVVGADGVSEAMGTIDALSADAVELTLEGGAAMTLPWAGPDPATVFAPGDEVRFERRGDDEVLTGSSGSLWRLQLGEHESSPTGAPVAIDYGEAVCSRGAGGLCECGFGGFEWIEHDLVASGATIAPGTTVEVDGWRVTHVAATRVHFAGTCVAGAVPGRAYLTLLSSPTP